MFIKLSVLIGGDIKKVLIPVADITYILEDGDSNCTVHLKSGKYFNCVDKINAVEGILTSLSNKKNIPES